jgi:Flp pilus assembly protein CpaB
MNRTRLLMIGFVALVLGAMVSFAVYRTLQSRSGGDTPPGVEVVVAANDIAVGAKVEDRDVKTVRFPAADLPANCFHLKSSVVGRGAILPIAKGEFFLPNKLAGENAGSGMPSLIPPGMRAVKVEVKSKGGGISMGVFSKVKGAKPKAIRVARSAIHGRLMAVSRCEA